MEPFLSFFAFGFVALLAAVSPGPDFLVVSKNSITHSRVAGVWTAIGVGCALLVHTAYTIVGIGLIISQSVLLFSVLKMLGALYLVWLGLGLLWARTPHDVAVPQSGTVIPKSNFRAFREGFLTNVVNPKATVFFVSIFSQFVSPHWPVVLQAVYGLEVAAIVASWFVALAFMLTLAPVRQQIGRLQKRVMQIMGLALIALGVKVALEQR